MENQTNVSNQNSQQIDQKPINQPVGPPTQQREIKEGNLHKPQGFLFVCMIVVTILSLLSTGYFAYRTQKLTKELMLLKNNQIGPQKTINDGDDQSSGSRLVWSKLDLSQPNEYFGIDVSSLMAKPAEALNCLSYEGKDYSSLNLPNLSSVTDDPNLSKFSQEIADHQFSDEQIFYSESGQKSISNAGKRSTRTITYQSVCKSNGLYFFMIDTSSIPEAGLMQGLRRNLGLRSFSVKAAGGMSYPSHFVYSNKDGKLTFMENFPPSNSHLTLPPLKSNEDRVEEYSGLTTTGSIAYYSCSRIYATSGSEVLVGCGGGDGPAGGSGIFLINLVSQNTKEKAFCLSNPKYSKRCFDDNGKVYKKELNQK